MNNLKYTEPVIGEYNVNWLQTEYLAAIRSARSAEGGGKVYGRGRPIYRNTYR